MILRNLPNCGFVLFWFVFITNQVHHILSYTLDDANNLHASLFNGYNQYVLPDNPVSVQAEYNLLSINSLDIKSQTISTSGWFTVVWTDSRLAWNESSDIDHIYTAESMLWHPSLIVENSVTDLTSLGDDNTQVRIRYDGQVRWEPSAILTTSCDMDITYFPFDIQSCDIQLASWGFHTDAVFLTFNKTNVDIQDFTKNGEWDLISTSQHVSETTEEDLIFRGLTFRITLERLSGHYIMSVIFPVILTAILTVVTFLLPVESGEKVGYILTVLLALAVLLTLFADSMPTTSKHTSILVLFLSFTLGLAAVVIVISILIIRLFHQPEDYTVPRWVYRMVHWLKNFKCREGDVQPFINDSKIEVGRDQKSEKHSLNKCFDKVQKYSNEDLALFFDNFFFVVFAVVFILVVLVFTITLSAGQ